MRGVMARSWIAGTVLLTVGLAPSPLSAQALPPSWTGFYVGGHLGGGWSPITYHDPAIPLWSLSHELTGAIGGVQAGYNHQTGPWVLGVEGEFSGSLIRHQAIDTHPPIGAATFAGDIFEAKVRWIGMLSGRFGYSWGPTLLYGKLGGVWANSDLHFQFVQTPGFRPTRANVTRAGVIMGGGIEHMLGRHWSARAEYNYANFGESGRFTYQPLPDGFVATFAQELHLVKLGFNYRFGR